jgi:hypothetical protein
MFATRRKEISDSCGRALPLVLLGGAGGVRRRLGRRYRPTQAASCTASGGWSGTLASSGSAVVKPATVLKPAQR